MTDKKNILYNIVGVGFMAALVFVSSLISIPIPTMFGVSRIHLGNAFCLLSGFLLGGINGGLAAGIGSMLYDFTNPLYIAESPITFINKFLMAYVCGRIMFSSRFPSQKKDALRRIVAASSGALTYVVLYLLKNFINIVFFLKAEVMTAIVDLASTRLVTSLTNAAIAVIISVPLSIALNAALKNGSALYRRLTKS